ncbi:MAG: protease HtpX [Desulfobulbus sp.]|nr:protease HtpX [Desulfobulbus sp.]
MKRIVLFLCTNLAVLLVLGLVINLLGVDQYLTEQGLDLGTLLVFAAVLGFGGSFISLFMSKTIAKMSTGARVIGQPQNSAEHWLLTTVAKLAGRANVTMPEVAIYEGPPNAFATGASRSNSLVAVSTGLLQSMNEQEVEAVLAHEMAHIANGDMVTLTLIQGTVNTFVFFLARVIGYLVDSMINKNNQNRGGYGAGYMITVSICQVLFGVLASLIVMYFSRQREFRADAGAAQFLGSPQPMIAALRRLGGLDTGALPQNMASSGIAGRQGLSALFATHPSIEDRIRALQS